MNKIATLQVQPKPCALAVEHEIFPEEVRQLLHGGAKMSIESYLRFDTIPSPFSMSAIALKHLWREKTEKKTKLMAIVSWKLEWFDDRPSFLSHQFQYQHILRNCPNIGPIDRFTIVRRLDQWVLCIEVSKHTPPIDGETFINQILERFQVADGNRLSAVEEEDSKESILWDLTEAMQSTRSGEMFPIDQLWEKVYEWTGVDKVDRLHCQIDVHVTESLNYDDYRQVPRGQSKA